MALPALLKGRRGGRNGSPHYGELHYHHALNHAAVCFFMPSASAFLTKRMWAWNGTALGVHTPSHPVTSFFSGASICR